MSVMMATPVGATAWKNANIRGKTTKYANAMPR